MDIQNRNFLSIEQLTDRYINTGRPLEKKTDQEVSFQDIFRQKTLEGADTDLKFSKHAAGRLNDRGIALDDSQMERLKDGVSRAKQKGIKDSLVLIDQMAFIVNVPNNTVVTAMDSTQTDENIFTNINGAVIV